MVSPQSWLVSSALRLFKGRSNERVNVDQIRALVNRFGAIPWPHREASIRPFAHQGLGGEWIYAYSQRATPKVILYLHGGGYFFCSPQTHRQVTVGLSREVGAATLALRYRLAPEHPYPAALEDAVAGYRWLLEQGIEPENIAIAGDSAGGGLALSMLVRLRDEGDRLPAACVCFSPWTDMAATGASLDSNDRNCAMFSAAGIRKARLLYLGDADPYSPTVSPLYADLRGLPPLLVHVSDSEVLFDDSTRLAARAREAGIDVTLKVWSRQPHVWQLFSRVIPEGRASLLEAGHFLRNHLQKGGAGADTSDPPYCMP